MSPSYTRHYNKPNSGYIILKNTLFIIIIHTFIELYIFPSIPYSSKRKRSVFTRSKAFSRSRTAAGVGLFSCNRF